MMKEGHISLPKGIITVLQLYTGDDNSRKVLLSRRRLSLVFLLSYLIGLGNALIALLVGNFQSGTVLWDLAAALFLPFIGICLSVVLLYLGMHWTFTLLFGRDGALWWQSVQIGLLTALPASFFSTLIQLITSFLSAPQKDTFAFEGLAFVFLGMVSLLIFIWYLVTLCVQMRSLHKATNAESIISLFFPLVIAVLLLFGLDALLTIFLQV